MEEFNQKSELDFIDNNLQPLIDSKIYSLTDEEILKCKENSFILIGKTGVGKTALLNVIYGEEIGKVGHTSKSETKDSNYYCIKEKIENEFIYFCIIDTPGLYDTNGFDADINQKKNIMKLISKENLKIKGLLFLSNFQNERFDASEQQSLLEYNALFPLKEFWKRIILVFTHYYGDPDGDSKEEILERSNKCLTDIIKRIMLKVDGVSKPINYKDINRQYVNIYSKIKNEKQAKMNDSIRKKLILSISQYLKLSPMFNQLQIFNFEKYEIDLNDEYLYDCDLTIYLDSDNNIINQKLNILNKYKKLDFDRNGQKITFNSQKCIIDENGHLQIINEKKEGIENILPDFKSKIGGAVTLFSVIGLIFSISFPFTFPICLITLTGGVITIKKSRDEKNKIEQEKIEEIIENQKIKEIIKKELDVIKDSESLIIQ